MKSFFNAHNLAKSMRTAFLFLLLAGISFGFEFKMNDSFCESTPVEIKFNQTGESICEYYLTDPVGGEHYLGYDYSCGNISVPWSNITRMGKDWEGIWNISILHTGNSSSRMFEIVRSLANSSINIEGSENGLIPVFAPGEGINVTVNWTEKCDDKRVHRFSILAWDTETEVYYGRIKENDAYSTKKITAPWAGGVYEVRLVHKVDGFVETLNTTKVSILSSKIDFSGIEFIGEKTLKIELSNRAEQAILRDITLVLKGGFKDITKEIISPYSIPPEGGSITTTISGGFRAAGLMAGTAYTAELYGIIDEPGKSYLIEKNFSGVFGGFCGDEICSGECETCPRDCSIKDCIGDRTCSKGIGENCENSPVDCACAQGDECYMGACVPPQERPMLVEVFSGDVPVKNVRVESPGSSCTTGEDGRCTLYAAQMDVLKASKQGYLEQTALASERVRMDITKEEEISAISKIPDISGAEKENALGSIKRALPFVLVVILIFVALKNRAAIISRFKK